MDEIFKLRIDIGNHGMLFGGDIADALEDAASRIREGEAQGVVYANGIVVGNWFMSE